MFLDPLLLFMDRYFHTIKVYFLHINSKEILKADSLPLGILLAFFIFIKQKMRFKTIYLKNIRLDLKMNLILSL